jgi:hypothetical protein
MRHERQTVKIVFKQLLDYSRADFHLASYLYTALFITGALCINYTFSFYRLFSIHFYSPFNTVYYFIFYATAYYGIAIPQAIFRKKADVLTKGLFWIKSAVFLAILSVVSSCFFIRNIKQAPLPPAELRYCLHVVFYLQIIVVYSITLLVMKLVVDRNAPEMYGITCKPFNPRPYLVMVLLIFPLALAVSFRIDFILAYPVFKPWLYNPAFGLSQWQMVIIFELIYGGSIIMCELLFRGAFTLGMKPLPDSQVLLPMTATYVFMHYNKPPLEALGSILAGYILGVIALRTRCIWAGSIVHVGTAYVMELTAYVQHYFRYHP